MANQNRLEFIRLTLNQIETKLGTRCGSNCYLGYYSGTDLKKFREYVRGTRHAYTDNRTQRKGKFNTCYFFQSENIGRSFGRLFETARRCARNGNLQKDGDKVPKDKGFIYFLRRKIGGGKVSRKRNDRDSQKVKIKVLRGEIEKIEKKNEMEEDEIKSIRKKINKRKRKISKLEREMEELSKPRKKDKKHL